jgi:hypothetical protein
MLFILSLIVRALTRLLVLSRADDATKDLEILILRHQLRVLRRKAGRPRFTALDRALLAAASRVLPRERWGSFLVTPQTLLRWRRTLVRWKWTYRKGRKPGRPPIDPEIAQLILRLARENSRWGCVRICGGAPQARHPGGRHDDQDPAATTRPGSCATTLRAHLDAVPQSAGRRDRGPRLLHGGDDPAQDAVRAVLRPAQH